MSAVAARGAMARTCISLFVLSSAFPIAAALLGERRRPPWLGVADVGVAAILVISAIAVAARARALVADGHRVAAFHTSQVVFATVPLLLGVFFVAGGRVDWPVLVIGLAWRGWLLLYTLPFLIALLEVEQAR